MCLPNQITSNLHQRDITSLSPEQIRNFRPSPPGHGILAPHLLPGLWALQQKQMAPALPFKRQAWRVTTRFRRRKRGQAGRRKHRHHQLNIGWWNIEGARNVLALTPESQPFEGLDVCLLGETMATSPLSIGRMKSHESLATKGERGRPSGGLFAGFSGPEKFVLMSSGPSHLHCRLRNIHIMCFYFNPETEVETIIQDTVGVVNEAGPGPVIVAGDFNCRIDKDDEKGLMLTSAMGALGLELLSERKDPTYFAWNGSSTIDLMFTNNPSAVINFSLEDMVIRKHRLVRAQFNFWLPTDGKGQMPLCRIIDQTALMNENRLNLISSSINEGDIDCANKMITDLIHDASRPRNKTRRKHRPWFDDECRSLRVRALTEPKGSAGYATARKEYIECLKKKRTEYHEAALIQTIQRAEQKPWALLSKSARQPLDGCIGPHELRSHFEPLLSRPADPPQERDLVVPEEWHNRPFTVDEVMDVFTRAPNNKAPGADRITNEQLKGSILLLATIWTALFNKCLETAVIPSSWKRSDMFLLYKGKGLKSDLNNYRGISLQATPYKLFTKLIKERLEKYLESLLSDAQHGFRKGRSTMGPIRRIIERARERLSANKQFLYVAFIDFQKAFDSVDRPLLLKKLRTQYNVGGRIYNVIESILKENIVNASDGCTSSGPIAQNIGVIQGDSLSPYLFTLFIDDVTKSTSNDDTETLLYADDLALITESADHLKAALSRLKEWALQNRLTVNVSKSKVMKFRKGGGYARDEIFTYNGQALEKVSDFCYLGVTLQPTCCFTKHILKAKGRALASLYSIKKLQLVSVKTALKLFNIKVFPVLSYGLKEIGPFLGARHFLQLDTVFSAFLKRTLGLALGASATLCHALVDVPFLSQQIIESLGPSIPEQRRYEEAIESKWMSFVEANYTEGPAFKNKDWTGPMYKNRHWVTAMTAHGFHHLICSNPDFHSPNDECECCYCNSEQIGLYHTLECPNLPPALSIPEIVKLLKV